MAGTCSAAAALLLLIAAASTAVPLHPDAVAFEAPGVLVRRLTAASEGPQPNVLVVYTSTSRHTQSLANAISAGLERAGADPVRVKTKDISDCDVRLEVLGWADAVLVGGPVEMGNMARPMEAFVTNMQRLSEAHPFMQGKVMAAFSTGGAVSAGAEAIIARANGIFQASGYTVPTFNDSWHFSTGLVAITGEVPFCQTGQTDRFPHGTGDDAVMHGCEVPADKPQGSLHPRFLELADEYGDRLLNFLTEHMNERRTRVSEEQDRLVLRSGAPATDVEIDWGEFGEDEAPGVTLPVTASGFVVGGRFAAFFTGAILASIAWSWWGSRQRPWPHHRLGSGWESLQAENHADPRGAPLQLTGTSV